MSISLSLENIDESFPKDFTDEQKAKAKTLFYKELSTLAHEFYGGKIQVLPKCGTYGFNWFNAWYTPGVSSVSCGIREDNNVSFRETWRGNTVAVVSDSTRVLGDGDCTPPGGMGVMEGKAYLMKYLGGVDAVPLCINSYDENGKHDPKKIIDFVKMVQPSFGAINLEDISQPNCYEVLDTLREQCDIPVWHDDAQGTACITLAALINALKLADKKIGDCRFVFIGAGASCTTIARLIIKDGGDPSKIIMFDSKSSLHLGREDLLNDKSKPRHQELCKITNPNRVTDMEEAFKGADVLIALSKPGSVKKEWISSMAEKAIVFSCANPVPEIYPYEAKEAGAFIAATGRGDFPNQVNNSVCFPGILKGALLVKAKKITDTMAIRCSHSIADFAFKRGISPDNITAKMTETEVFAVEAADVAMQAIKDGVARENRTWDEVYKIAMADIENSRKSNDALMSQGLIKEPPKEMLEKAFEKAVEAVKK